MFISNSSLSSLDKSYLYFPVWFISEGCSKIQCLVMIFQPEPLQNLDSQQGQLQLCKPPAHAHSWSVAECDISIGVSMVVIRAASQPSLRDKLGLVCE